MAENLLLCALALLLGLGLAWLFLIPLFNQLFVLQVGLSLFEDRQLWLFLVGLLAFVGLLSGAYPALYVASFRPARILRGRQQFGERRWFTRALLTAQFVIAFFAVIGSVLLALNGRYLLTQPWGYDYEQAVVVQLSDPGQLAQLRAAALQHSAVTHVASARDHVGASMRRAHVRLEGDGTPRETIAYAVGPLPGGARHAGQ